MKINVFKNLKDQINLFKATKKVIWDAQLDSLVKNGSVTSDEADKIRRGEIRSMEELDNYRFNKSGDCSIQKEESEVSTIYETESEVKKK